MGAARVACVSKLSVPDSLVAEYRKWSFPNDEITRCYIKCMLESMELFNESTGANVANLLVQFKGHDERPNLEDDIKACADSNPNNDDSCTWAYRQFICFNNSHLSLIQTSVKN